MKPGMALLAIVLLAAPAAGAQGSGGFLARGSAGYDVASDNVVLGAGLGYYLPVGGLSTEIMVDVFGGFYTESSTEGDYRFDETGGLLYVAVHYDLLLGHRPGETSLYALAGAGVFYGSSWWDEIQTYLPDGTETPYDGGISGGGPLVDVGIGFAFLPRLDARIEVPVLYMIGVGFSIPIIATLTFRF